MAKGLRTRQFLGGVAVLAALGATSTGVMAQSLTEELSCDAEGPDLRSQNSDVSTYINFANESEERASIYWLNFRGQRVFYNYLQPGEQYVQQTYVTHPWLITTNEQGECAGLYMPSDMTTMVKFR